MNLPLCPSDHFRLFKMDAWRRGGEHAAAPLLRLLGWGARINQGQWPQAPAAVHNECPAAPGQLADSEEGGWCLRGHFGSPRPRSGASKSNSQALDVELRKAGRLVPISRGEGCLFSG